MNQVLGFVGLQIAEIAAACVAGYGFYQIGLALIGDELDKTRCGDRVLMGIAGCGVTLLSIVGVIALCRLLVSNWQWAGMLVTKG